MRWRRLAGNNQWAGAASGTVANIYLSLGDFRTAEVEGKRAIDLLKLAPQNDPFTKQLTVKAMQIVATLCAMQGRTTESETYFQQGIKLAQRLTIKSFEANLWDVRGVMLLRANQLPAAEQSLRTSLDIRESIHDQENLPFSKEHLAELELKRASPNYPTALKLVDEALSSPSALFKAGPQYYPIHIRGQILLHSGDKQRALAEFRRAVAAADAWRRGALPGDITNTQTVVLLHEVYQDFAHLAAQISLETKNASLRDEAFDVLASNRAASLREQLNARSPPIRNCLTATSKNYLHCKAPKPASLSDKTVKPISRTGSLAHRHQRSSKTSSRFKVETITFRTRKIYRGIHLEIFGQG